MKLAIVGSREGIPKEIVEKFVNSLESDIIVISGGAKGVDTIAVNQAKLNGILTLEILPDYSQYGKQAPLIRNQEIANQCDAMIVFWNGQSKGSLHAAKCAVKLNKPVKILNVIEKKQWNSQKTYNIMNSFGKRQNQ